MSTLAETFLRFLAAPRKFQRDYVLIEGQHRYGCELREGYFEGQEGLHLLLVVGQDALYWSDFRAITPANAEEVILRLYSVLWLITEHNESLNLASEGDEWMTQWAALWRLLRQLSIQILNQCGLPLTPPTKSYSEAFLSVCDLVV
jgi:hypothetical protein